MAVPMFNEHPIELGLAGRRGGDRRALRDAARTRMRGLRRRFPATPSPFARQHRQGRSRRSSGRCVSGDSPLDRYLYRDDQRRCRPAAVRGMELFFSTRLRCSECHGGFNLSGPIVVRRSAITGQPLFHNTGLYNVDGRGAYPADRPRAVRQDGQAGRHGPVPRADAAQHRA